MALLDRNINIRIKDVQHLHFKKSSVLVAPRPYHALAFRVKGNAVFTKGDYSVTASEGSITYMPANYGYHADYTDENEIIVIHFDSETELDIEIYDLYSPHTILNLFRSARNTWYDAAQAYYYRTMAIFYEILADISAQTDVFYNSELYSDFFEAVEYMKKNFTDYTLTVDRLACMANMSNTYFRKLFHERFGENPSKYLVTLRLQYAEKLLSKGNLTVGEVALMSGFNDSKYFSRVVKKVYGYPPSRIFIHN